MIDKIKIKDCIVDDDFIGEIKLKPELLSKLIKQEIELDLIGNGKGVFFVCVPRIKIEHTKKEFIATFKRESKAIEQSIKKRFDSLLFALEKDNCGIMSACSDARNKEKLGGSEEKK